MTTDTTTWQWLLKPHVYDAPNDRYKAFAASVRRLCKKPRYRAKRLLSQAIADPNFRRELKDCYIELWKNHNLVSMTLYTGPAPYSANLWSKCCHSSCWQMPYCDDFCQEHNCGWLLTGDAKLSGQRRLMALKNAYGQLLPLVSVLVLPHHGSKHNFRKALLDIFPNITVALACSGDMYGHPSPCVETLVKKNGIHFHKVGKTLNSEFTTVAISK